MNTLEGVVVKQVCFSDVIPKSTLVELKLNIEYSMSKYGAVEIDGEIFQCSGDSVKRPYWICIDIKNSSINDFVGKRVSLIQYKDKSKNIDHPLSDIIYY